MWQYYNQILRKLGINLFSIPVTTRPYNRIPSDNFPATDIMAELMSIPFILLFSTTFVWAWKSTFPSAMERILWRLASAYIIAFGTVGGCYSGICHYVLLPRAQKQESLSVPNEIAPNPQSVKGFRNYMSRLAANIRNISPNKDPKLVVPFEVLIPISLFSGMYCLCRAYILVEDIIGLRKLPSSAFQTVDWSKYIPHI